MANTTDSNTGYNSLVALENRETVDDARMFSPSAARNQAPIASVLAERLPRDAAVLEVGSGTGEHAVAVVGARPDVTWRPSDPDPASRASVAAWAAHTQLAQILAPLDLDARAERWEALGPAQFDAVVSINMIHIAPWSACQGLAAGAGRVLRPGGVLILYGPFSRGGVHTAASNAAFDASLKSRDPSWGVRDIEEVAHAAEDHGLVLRETLAMPANNQVVVFDRH